MKVQREELLTLLESVQPGLSPKETVQQSSCFVFQGGKLMTYNEEVACRVPTTLTIEGAVASTPLLHLLQKVTEKEIEVTQGKGQLIVKGRNKKAGVRMEKEIELPISDVEPPDKWKPIPRGFVEAIDKVYQCAYPNESHGFHITCVHIHPDWVEASDNQQAVRCNVKTGVEASTLVRHSAIKHIVPFGVTKYCITSSWMHFKNESGLVISCRIYLDDYPELNDFFSIVGGKKVSMPKGLSEVVEKAEGFVDDTMYDGSLKVWLKRGHMKVEASGDSGWYYELKKLAYVGEPMEFLIAPKMLKEITHRHNDVIVGPRKMKIKGESLLYVTALGMPGESKEKKNGKKKQRAEEEE